jgi:hypothetical protein
MANGRLRALLHAQQGLATRNATTQQPLLHVAPPRECNTQQAPSGRAGEVRRLIEAVAAANGAYWKPSDVEEAYRIALGDLDSALECFRALAMDYGLTELTV